MKIFVDNLHTQNVADKLPMIIFVYKLLTKYFIDNSSCKLSTTIFVDNHIRRLFVNNYLRLFFVDNIRTLSTKHIFIQSYLPAQYLQNLLLR